MSADETARATRVPPYFRVGVLKLAVMSIFTWGFYDLFWSYKQWDAVRRRSGVDFNPWLRTILAMPIFFFPLFRDIAKSIATQSSVRLRFPTLLALCFAVVSLIVFVPGWLNVLSLFAVVPLMEVQGKVNACHRELGFDPGENTRLNPLNLIGVTLGVVGYGLWFWPWIKWFVATSRAA